MCVARALSAADDEAPEADPRESSLAVVPGPYYTEETSLAFGVKVVYSFYTSERAPLEAVSVFDADATYTLRRQTIITSQPRIYLDGRNWIIGGRYDFRLYPDRFWGVGNNTRDLYQEFSEDSFRFTNELQRYVGSRLWTGLVHEGRITRINDVGDLVDDGETVTGPPLIDDSLPGTDGGFVHGLGLSLLHDTRNHALLPQRGGYHYARWVAFHSGLGSDHDFVSWHLDLRRFFPLTADGSHVLAVQGWAELHGGDVPFYELSRLGGPRQMRGYYRGRYRDAHYVTTQAEWRFPIYWRLSGVAYGAVGEVFGQDAFALDRIRYSGGTGLRVLFGKDVVIRGDFAIGPGTTAVTIDGGQVF